MPEIIAEKTAMNHEELANMIIKELGKHRNRQAIAEKVCEESGLNWSEAEKLITDVEAQNKGKIAARQGPFLMIISIATLLLGIGLIAYNMEIMIAIFNSDLIGRLLSLRSGYYRLASLVTGVGMTIGGFYGIWTTLASFFPSE
jgi:hypothetical protein